MGIYFKKFLRKIYKSNKLRWGLAIAVSIIVFIGIALFVNSLAVSVAESVSNIEPVEIIDIGDINSGSLKEIISDYSIPELLNLRFIGLPLWLHLIIILGFNWYFVKHLFGRGY